ncbi:MAG: alcohol dehydrogenase catalytic domain-containing protein [Terrimesophilobacter sp.]
MTTHETYLVGDGAGSSRLETSTYTMPGPGEIGITVHYAGLCKSDLEGVRFSQELGERFGHEVYGRVSESADPEFPVGASVLALIGHGYASHVVTATENVVRIPDAVDAKTASIAEPVACILAGMDMLDLRDVDRAAVVGAGFMGLLVVKLLAVRGLSVTVFEPRATARATALRMGASEAKDPSERGPKDEFPLVIEVTGSQPGLTLAESLTVESGVLSITGFHQSQGGERQIRMADWNWKCLTVINAQIRSLPRTLMLMERAIRLFSNGTLDMSTLITHELALAEVPEFIEAGGDRDDTYIKAVVDCSPTT